MRREIMRTETEERQVLHVLGNPESHLWCYHQQLAARTKEKQTSNPLKLGQFQITNEHLLAHMSLVGLWSCLTKQQKKQ